MKRLSTAFAIALATTAATAQTSGPAAIIRQQPEGILHDNYARSSYYFYTSYSSVTGVYHGIDLWSTSRFVEGNDGCVYLYNPYSQLPTRSWLKLDPAGNGKFVAHLPQVIREGVGYDDNGNETTTIYYAFPVKEYELEDGALFCKADTLADGTVRSELNFVLRNDSLIMTDDYYIGLMNSEMKWTGYADTDIKVGRVDYKPNTLPQTAALQDYKLAYQTRAGGNEQKIVKVAFADDGKVYLLNPYNNSKAEVIVGSYDGAKTVSFPTKQYLGADWATTHHLFFMARGYERIGQQINYGDWYKSLQMTVDADRKTLTAQPNSVMIINAGDSLQYALSYYFDPTLTRFEDLALTPPAPVIDEAQCQAYSAEAGYGFVSFFLSRYDASDNFLNNAKYYYRLYADDEAHPFTFTSDSYTNVSQPMTDVPVTFADYIDFFTYTLQGNDREMERSVNIYDGSVARWGVQAVYKGGDTENLSPIAWWNVPTGINAVQSPSKTVVRTEYYDLSGRRLSRCGHGLNIKVTVFSDGTRAVTKLQGE